MRKLSTTFETKQKTVKENIRVFFVIPKEPEGSTFMIFAKRQVASLQKAGIISRVFYLTSRTSVSVLVKEFKRFKEEISVFKPDLIHAQYGTMTAFFCAITTRLPLILTFRGTDINLHPSTSFLRRITGVFLSQISALKARQIMCVSDEIKGKLWWKKDFATVTPSGVDTSIFYPQDKGKVRAELGWDRNEFVVLFNSGDDPIRKRLDLAKASIKFARTICEPIRFEVLDGYMNTNLIPILMNASDCLLCTSDSEGSPNIVKEALACNLPVVSVDVGDVKERLAGVNPSRIVERDPEEIGRAVAEMLTNGKRSNGSQVIQDLSLDRIAEKILQVYNKALRFNRHI
jgi:teichuronic acid biosynthesis glycosyltransferase TuaC